MKINSLISQINTVDREIIRLEKQVQSFDSKVNSKQIEAQRILDKITREKDFKRVVKHQKDLTKKNDQITKLEKQKTSKNDQLAKKQKKKLDLSEKLRKEEGKEIEKTKKEQKDLLSIQQEISKEMEKQKRLTKQNQTNALNDKVLDEQFDVFISHAHEDKADVAKPLAQLLIENNVNVWLDDFELLIGDSLRRKIDRGLSNSRYGIVVLSESFFKKEWPQKELDGLVAKESEGVKVILPIWHKVSKNEVLKFSPTLADKKALNTSSFTLEEIAKQISQLFK